MRYSIFVVLFLYLICPVKSQDIPTYKQPHRVGIKSNILYDLTSTINIGIELVASKDITFDLSANYNNWNTYGDSKIHHFLVQPELRYWFGEVMHGHFIGGHIHYGQFNIQGVSDFGLSKKYRYEGDLLGVGFSYGYQWKLGKHWRMEATAGFGFTHIEYSKHYCSNCKKKIGDYNENHWTPTKLGLNIIYIFR